MLITPNMPDADSAAAYFDAAAADAMIRFYALIAADYAMPRRFRRELMPPPPMSAIDELITQITPLQAPLLLIIDFPLPLMPLIR